MPAYSVRSELSPVAIKSKEKFYIFFIWKEFEPPPAGFLNELLLCFRW